MVIYTRLATEWQLFWARALAFLKIRVGSANDRQTTGTGLLLLRRAQQELGHHKSAFTTRKFTLARLNDRASEPTYALA